MTVITGEIHHFLLIADPDCDQFIRSRSILEKTDHTEIKQKLHRTVNTKLSRCIKQLHPGTYGPRNQ